MANSLARSFTDYRADRTRAATRGRRSASSTWPSRAGRPRAMELAVTVASPTEKDAPVVANTSLTASAAGRSHERGPAKAKGDLAAAERIAEDFARASGPLSR